MSTTPPTTVTLPIRTQHCRFCNHLLLATTRDLSTLPRRSAPAADASIILPLEKLRSDGEQERETSTHTPSTKHVTLLLSTTIPDRRATLIRREDGIEKRILLRCGRCRVVVGYYLDRVHWGESGALVETEKMGGEGVGEKEWRVWAGDA